MRNCAGIGFRTHLERFNEGEGNSTSQLDGGTRGPQDVGDTQDRLRHQGEPIARSAILAILLTAEVGAGMVDGV
jgi:hypothetical protein